TRMTKKRRAEDSITSDISNESSFNKFIQNRQLDLSKLSNCDIIEHGDGYSCINLMERIKYISTSRKDINIHRIFLSKSELPELARNYLDIDVNCTNEKDQRSYFENLFYLSALEMFKLYNRSIVNEYLNNIANKIINENNLTDLYFNSSQNLFNYQNNRSITKEEQFAYNNSYNKDMDKEIEKRVQEKFFDLIETNKQLQNNCETLQN
ncbi:unnamed protein product, partial [Brachionus calyciflorus]